MRAICAAEGALLFMVSEKLRKRRDVIEHSEYSFKSKLYKGKIFITVDIVEKGLEKLAI